MTELCSSGAMKTLWIGANVIVGGLGVIVLILTLVFMIQTLWLFIREN